MGTGITLTNNEVKNIIKLIDSLENRRILLKETTRKIATQEEEFLNFIRPLMKKVLNPLTKNVLLPFALSAGMSAADTTIYGSRTTALIISNKEMEDAMKKLKSIEKSVLLIIGINETIKNKVKEQK